ncbi:MAG: hypothetical protein LBO71_03725 [Prevotellaceae bacterium]|nr:hypothetical protein [Prevotellaceae bacterium]
MTLPACLPAPAPAPVTEQSLFDAPLPKPLSAEAPAAAENKVDGEPKQEEGAQG